MEQKEEECIDKVLIMIISTNNLQFSTNQLKAFKTQRHPMN